ncbi:MAG: creatininase family protein [Candidatus Helarchaeota archaeon]
MKTTRKMMNQLYKMGFRIVILLTGHYPGGQIKNVYKAAQQFSAKYEDGFALGIPEQALVTDLGYVGDHAAEWETSIMMAINPDWVDLTRLTRNLTFSERCTRHGIMGRDPLKGASPEKGRQVIQEIVNRLATAIEEVRQEQSMAPFERIYKQYRSAMKEIFNIRHPLTFEKLYKLQGIETKHEIWNFIKWRLFKKGKQILDFKS